MILTLLLITLCVIFVTTTVLLLRLALRASETISNYENFFNDTLSDIDSVLEMLDTLMARRRVVADDPDVQNVYRVIGITRDILMGYANAAIGKNNQEKKKEQPRRQQQAK